MGGVKKTDDFANGLAYALVYLIKWFDQPGMAKNILKHSGYTVDSLEKAGIAEYDLKIIREGLT